MESSNNKYSIKDLEEKTGVKVRTIRFYIKENLVPPPNGTGGGASYDDTHLLSLQVIKVLHESKLKLSGIKEALAGMSPEQMSALVAEAESGKRNWDNASLRNWVNPEKGNEATVPPCGFSFAAIGSGEEGKSVSDDTSNILSKLTRQAVPAQETWMRFNPIDGVEIQVRDDVDPKTKALVMQLIQQMQNQQ